MKKHVLFLMISALCFLKPVMGQPTITSANMYAPGDVLTLQSADTTGITEGAAGANQTWNFANLQNMGAATTQSIVAASGTTYFSDFPAADIAIDAGGNTFSYLDISGNDVYELGFGSASLTLKYTDAQKFQTFPVTYNTSFTDNLVGSYMVGPFLDNRTGDVSFVADGYGTLILPTGTINNVLRMKYIQNFTDVQEIGGGNTVTTLSNTVTYYWMTPGNKNALMDISYVTTTVIGFSTHLKTVYYYPGSVSTGNLLSPNANLQIFPNPASDKVNLSLNLDKGGLVKLSLYNVSGQEVSTPDNSETSAGLYTREIDLADVPAGVYFLKMDMDNENLFTHRLVKE